MKLRSIIITAAASVLVLSSCLKKTDRLGFIGDKGSIVSEIATHNEHDPLFISLAPTPAVETVDVFKVAFHNAKNLPSGDIKIKLVLDPTILADYNADNGTSYLPLPFASYTLSDPTLEITLPKGTYGEHTVKATITKAALSLTSTYGVGFKIASVSEGVISDIAGKFLFVVGVKNAYDGIYTVVSGNVQRYSAPGVPTVGDALNGSLAGNPDVWMATSGANTVDIAQPSSTGFYWGSGSGSQVAGIDGIRVAVDPVSNLTNITSAANATLTNWAGHTNDYNPATKTFRLAFRWNPTANVREYEVVLRYKGPRP